ncbi:MAG: heavy metal translocating P-type ATPase [Aestuariivirga sp.]
MSCCASTLVAAHAESIVGAQRFEEIKASGRRLGNGSTSYTMSVPTIHCGACVSVIEKSLARMPGVQSARVNLTLRMLTLTLAEGNASLATIVQRLEEIGYPPLALDGAENEDKQQIALVRALAVSGFAATNIMLLSVSVWTGADGATRDLFHFISALIAVPALAYAGQPFFRSAIAALKNRRINMDVPISLGVLLATFMSLFESLRGGEHAYFDAAISLVFFLLIGRTLDHMMRVKARQLVSQLARLSAKGGMVVGPLGALTYTPLDAIRPGMLLRVAAGERMPVDGEIVSGETEIDRSFITGESEPVRGGPHAAVEAGTMNLTGAIDIRATRLAKSSFLADVMAMMAAAEEGRGRYVRIADRMARIYSPAVHLLALSSFIGWMLATNGGWHQSLTIAISVLIITCPCALGLAVPVAHVIGASRLFRAGILMKDGSALERLAEVDRVVFDKTGTLTTGEPKISSSAIPQGELAAVAKALASHSRHPASRALSEHLAGESDMKLKNIREVPGYGVTGGWNGKQVRLGRAGWVAEIVRDSSHREEGISFGIESGRAFPIEITEQLRGGALEAVKSFEAVGMQCEVLSGDSHSAVARIASQLGIGEYRYGLHPAEKLDHLSHLSNLNHKVLMIGDGLNDAPSLAAAHVSMAPSSASDISRNAADFVFTRGDLMAAPLAHRVAVSARKIIRQNFGLAVAYNVLAVPLAMAGYLNPLIAAIAMSTSSILVIGNSMRLLGAGRSERAFELHSQVQIPATGLRAA